MLVKTAVVRDREFTMQPVLHVRAFDDNYIWVIRGAAADRALLVDPGDAAPVLAALVKYYDVSVVQAVKTIVDDTFTGGIQFGTLETGEVGLAPFDELDSLVSAKVKVELEQIKADIIGESQNETLNRKSRG